LLVFIVLDITCKDITCKGNFVQIYYLIEEKVWAEKRRNMMVVRDERSKK
jgi:hypothetical protein